MGMSSDNMDIDQPHVSDFVLKNVKSFSELNANSLPQARLAFANVLAREISKAKLTRINRGNVIELYLPLEEKGDGQDIAVKVFKTWEVDFDAILSKHPLLSLGKDWYYRHFTNTDAQSILNSKDYLFMSHRLEFVPMAHTLTRDEKAFAYFAFEHKTCQDLYGSYVLPSIFVSFRPNKDLTEEIIPWMPSDNPHITQEYADRLNKSELEDLAKKGKLTPDKRKLIIPKGQLVFAQVEDFQKFRPTVFSEVLDDGRKLADDEKDQLRDFKEKVISGFKKTGFYPDPALTDRTRGNLRFTESGKLVLADSNVLGYDVEKDEKNIRYLEDIDRILET